AFAARGCNFDVVDSVGQTLLNSSIADGEYKLVRWLLAHGVRADRRNRTADETALHWLAFDQQHMEADLVDLLVKQGADVNAVNTSGETPLRAAAGAERCDIAPGCSCPDPDRPPRCASKAPMIRAL